MMRKDARIPRRTFLRGLGAAVALPFLEAMTPRRAQALALAPEAIPNRLVFFYIPNGVHMSAWTPGKTGADFDLPSTLEPLGPLRDRLLVLTGLTQDKARPNGDGAGDHARSAASFLTGTQARKTDGADIRAGISADQIAAERVGRRTRLPSLELGCEPGLQSGNCDSGYSCAYSANISWKTASLPMAKETSPRALFERLFTGGPAGAAGEGLSERLRRRKSLLDFVREDADRLRGRLGPTDRRKLGEYLDALREVEVRIGRAERDALVAAPPMAAPEPGVPKDYGEHIRLLCDLLALALRTDATRIATFMFANEGSNRSYRQIGVPEGHHDLSHHGGDKDKQEKIARINRFHLEEFARFLGSLRDAREGEGTVLDHAMVVLGSGLSDGNQHNHDNLPVILAGGGGGTLAGGRHIRYAQNTPLNNLYLSLLDRIDAAADTLGDSTGRLHGLFGPAHQPGRRQVRA